MPLPRFLVILLIKTIRLFTTTLATPLRRLLNLHHYPATTVISIPTLLTPHHPGNLFLHVYYPPRFNPSKASPLPCILNFHGGGFAMGHPHDDSLFAETLTTNPDQSCIVISASYRLAPEHTFPVPIQDACSALIYLFTHSTSLGIDPANIALSGFSAGGNLCFSVPILLSQLKQSHSAVNGIKVSESWNIKGIAAFYPSLDKSTTRTEKLRTMRKPELAMPQWLGDVFGHAYTPAYLGIDSGNKLLSPGIQEETVLREALPKKIRILMCEYDMLCKEAEDFVGRLEGWGWEVNHEFVKDVGHAWDKWPKAKPDPRAYYRRMGQWLAKDVWSDPVLEG